MRLPLILLLFVLGRAIAAEAPYSPRLAANPPSHVAGGFQIVSGPEGTYQLFRVEQPDNAAFSLGRFNGSLAGVALTGDGEPLALTRDGALNQVGDDPRALALPDSRWNMKALAWWRDKPLALHFDGESLFTVTPESDLSWKQDERPVVRAPEAARAELVPLGRELHLLWTSYGNGLANGVVRHNVLRDDKWEELAPLPVGDADDFTCYSRNGGINLVAVVPDPLRDGPTRVVARNWRGGAWLPAEAPKLSGQDLAGVSGLAAAGYPVTLWLTTSQSGALLADAQSGRPAQTLATGMPAGRDWSRFTGLLTLGAFAALFLIYCRRSRQMSRATPGKAPDLLSRGAALGIDWLLASIVMGAYHVASGDIYILSDLMTVGELEKMFWINLAGLAVFMALFEGFYGATPGKYLAGMRVRSALGGPPSLLQALMRNVMRGIDMFPLSVAFPGLVGAVVTMLGPRRQRIGDMLASTVVRRHIPLSSRDFLLASASPRRLELMRELVKNVRAHATDVDEEAISGETPEKTVRRLAEAKAHAAADIVKPPEVVVAADTVVVLDGEVLGKPKDAADATRMLEKLSGRSHSVFTGVMLWDPATGQGLSDVEETEVEFRTLSPREIAEYVASGDPLDKAGAYGVQTGFLVKQVRGSLSNVAGLPMEKLQGMLALLDS